MKAAYTRRRLLGTGAALAGATLLPQARACEYFSANLRVVHPWTRATPEGATTTLVSMNFDDVTVADRLIEVITPVAEGAELVVDGEARALAFEIPEGQVSVLDERGSHRLRLLGLRHPLEIARTYPMRLVFEQGGMVLATLNVDYPRFR
ncbi:copper chaperone PCu(A)C [Leptothrix discophora]|uniref:Copper chaperone PCu(A)C n=1 Tax=Leptothrix discophora TaxID=89 RepID=A0ABT9G0K0_LEPDI|nr:copper chaperone PCu(A)C [Leptothrix discophora]MDP4300001.1 copper chaperone PCu(A)C [Leptothrix discophora]